ncbi:MAG TPA: carboxymuconolactone decarboxylase family protein, partial [Pseudomonas sp.]|nr:carboxymuconolactone decarboxylase family protein [Pseudomonas sp.]
MSLHTSNTLAAAYLAVFGSLTLASLEAAGNERHERGMAVIEHLS